MLFFLNILASERFLPFNMSYPGYASIFNLTVLYFAVLKSHLMVKPTLKLTTPIRKDFWFKTLPLLRSMNSEDCR